jgi:hypothetical protein
VGTTSFANAQNESNNFINTIWKIPNSKQIDDTQKEEIPIINNEQGAVFDDAKVKIILLNSIEFIGDSCIKTSFNYKSIESETYFYKRFPLKNSKLILFKLFTKKKGKLICEKRLFVKQCDNERIKIAFDNYCSQKDIPKLKFSSFFKLSK